MRLIGLTGPAGCGKDTVGSLINARYGHEPKALAAPLKRALNTMFGWTMRQWDDREWKERTIPHLGKSPREMAQTLGTEWGRNLVHNDVWVLAALGNEPDDSRVVITDVRFDNEARAIRSRGGVVLCIWRDGCSPVAAHSSEAGVNDELIDWYVDNNGTVHDLAGEVREALTELNHLRYDDPDRALVNGDLSLNEFNDLTEA